MSFKRYLAGIGMLLVCSNALAFELPLLAKEAREQGYELPKPYGLSIATMQVEQGITVDHIGFSGLAFLGNQIPPDMVEGILDIKTDNGRQDSQVYSLRGDVWLLPFLNVYGIAGKMTGTSSTRVTMKSKINWLPFEESFNFNLDLDGYLYGVGTVIAGGMGNWFTLIDASKTKTKLTVIEGTIDAFVLSPRIGYDFKDKGFPLRVWAGGMYQHVEQELTGYLHKLDFGPEGNWAIGLFDPDKKARFLVSQNLVTTWNTLLGFQYQFNQQINLVGEAGLGKRISAMVSLEYRF